MARKNYKLIVSTGNAERNQTVDIQQGDGARGKAVRLKAEAGVKYQLLETGAGKAVAPHYVKVRRIGKNLEVLF